MQSKLKRNMTILNRIKVTALTLSILAGLCPTAINAQNPSLTVFAAASMKNALDDVNAAFTGDTGIKVTASYATSPVLIKQIEQGAPADIFVSADLDWMDYGSQKKLIKEETRLNMLGNRLVLIAPSDSNLANVAIGPGFDLAGLAGDGRIATGDVSTVPVGKYAKTALQKLGSWAAASSKMAMTESVRAALMLVARGEAPIGIVYETDAKVEPRVKVIGVFPEDSHPPVTYPVAATVTSKPDAALYLDYLHSSAAKAIFEKYGFSFLVKGPS
jgi:molybdate transport system substrate-binding protein